MVLINSKVLKLIVTVSKPKFTTQFGLFEYCWSKQSQIISSGKQKKARVWLTSFKYTVLSFRIHKL